MDVDTWVFYPPKSRCCHQCHLEIFRFTTCLRPFGIFYNISIGEKMASSDYMRIMTCVRAVEHNYIENEPGLQWNDEVSLYNLVFQIIWMHQIPAFIPAYFGGEEWSNRGKESEFIFSGIVGMCRAYFVELTSFPDKRESARCPFCIKTRNHKSDLERFRARDRCCIPEEKWQKRSPTPQQ